jgi:hypothetical protein
MTNTIPGTRLDRRSALALLPTLGVVLGDLLPAAAVAQTETSILPSWNDGPAKQAILDFVRVTTDRASPNYVAPEDRIAEFDQDGTLWVEHPLYTQIVFCLDRVGALVKARPALRDREPFKTVLSGDREAIAKLSMRHIFEIVVATQSGMTVKAFRSESREWLATAQHPRWGRLYTELVYQPMLEYVKAGTGSRLSVLVLHDDADREYAMVRRTDCLTPRSIPSARKCMAWQSARAGPSSA